MNTLHIMYSKYILYIPFFCFFTFLATKIWNMIFTHENSCLLSEIITFIPNSKIALHLKKMSSVPLYNMKYSLQITSAKSIFILRSNTYIFMNVSTVLSLFPWRFKFIVVIYLIIAVRKYNIMSHGDLKSLVPQNSFNSKNPCSVNFFSKFHDLAIWQHSAKLNILLPSAFYKYFVN